MAKRKPGKYDHLFPKLQKMPPADLEYQQRVEDQKMQIRKCQRCEGTKGEPIAIGEYSTAPCTACNGTGRRTLSGQTLAAEYVIARADVEALTALLSAANLQLEAVSQLMIASQDAKDPDWGAFGASDRSVKLTNGDVVRVDPEIYPAPSNETDFRNWCFANGLKDKMKLPPKAMTDLAKRILLNGEKEPTGLKIYVRHKIVYTPLKTMEAPVENSDRDDSSEFADLGF